MAQAWWQDRQALRRYVVDLINSEFALLRPGFTPLAPEQWTDDLKLDAEGFGADSLELLSLATALNETLHLHRGGAEDYLLVRRRLGDWLDVIQWCLERNCLDIGFRSSGTAGPPKLCVHPIARLSEEVDFHHTLFADRRRVIRVVPSHHIYGFLFSILLPGRLGVAVIDARRSISIRPQSGDLIVGYPEFWARQLHHNTVWPADVMGVVSTGPCRPEVAAALRATRLSQFIEIYGSSETAGLGWRDADAAGYTLFPFLARQGEHIVHQASGLPLEPQDRLNWLSARQFRVGERIDGAIQVGGINVSPAHVVEVLQAHPDVAKAAVRPMQLGEGIRLKAFIVPQHPGQDEAVLRAALELWIAERLLPAEQPRSLTFGAALPVGAYGKAADWPVGA